MYFVAQSTSDYLDQRRRWQQLVTIVPDIAKALPEARDRLASAWSDEDGWRIGYLNLYNSSEAARHGGHDKPDDPGFHSFALSRNAQGANQYAQTIALAVPLTARGLSAEMIERNTRRIITSLYQQLAEFPDNETHLMGRLLELPPKIGSDASLFAGLKPDYSATAAELEIETWWVRQTVAAAESYVVSYPDDAYSDTALLAAYEVTGKTSFLRQIIKRDPQGQRTEEARAFLWAQTRTL